MATVSKLFANGAFQTSVPLDEITKTIVSQSSSNIYASEFDEISIYPIANGLAKRETNTGKLMVSGYFDEYIVNSPQVIDVVSSGLVFNLKTAPSSGTTWTDASGNGYHATLQGSASYVSNNGGGIKLNNSGINGTDYISVPYNISSNTITVEIVASFNSTQQWATVWANESYLANKGYYAYQTTSNNINWGNISSTITASNAIRHWVFVINGTSRKLYLNGTAITDTTGTNPSGGYATNNLYFGARHANDGTSYKDTMNNSTSAYQPVFYQMRIYNKSLSSAEITQNYNAVRGTYGI